MTSSRGLWRVSVWRQIFDDARLSFSPIAPINVEVVSPGSISQGMEKNKKFTIALLVVLFCLTGAPCSGDTNALSDAEIVKNLGEIGLSGLTLLQRNKTPSLDAANTLFRQTSLRFLSDSNMKSASDGYKNVLRSDPSNGSAWLNVERFAEFFGQWDQAVKFEEALLKYAPQSPEATVARQARRTQLIQLPELERKSTEYEELMRIAKNCATKGHMKSAIRAYEFAYSVDSSRWEAIGAIAQILYKQNQFEMANNVIKKALPQMKIDDQRKLQELSIAAQSKPSSAQSRTIASSSIDPWIERYLEFTLNEVNWFQSVKGMFNQEEISKTCANYKPTDYTVCYMDFLKQKVEPRKPTATGLVLASAVGVAVLVNTSKSASQTASVADKVQIPTRYGLDLIDLSLELVMANRRFSAERRPPPKSPDALAMNMVFEDLDKKFEMVIIDKVGQTFTQVASQTCLVQGSCPALKARESALETLYWKVKEKAPKNYKPLTDGEIEAAMTKAHIDPKQSEIIFGGGNGH